MGELWKKVDHDGVKDSTYEVSTEGRVRNTRTGRIVHGRLNKSNGYYRVNLRGKEKYIHRLVADAFGTKEKSNLYVRHIDGNRTNNAISNLEWIKPKYKK